MNFAHLASTNELDKHFISKLQKTRSCLSFQVEPLIVMISQHFIEQLHIMLNPCCMTLTDAYFNRMQLQDAGYWTDAATLAAAHLKGSDYARFISVFFFFLAIRKDILDFSGI